MLAHFAGFEESKPLDTLCSIAVVYLKFQTCSTVIVPRTYPVYLGG